MIGLGTLSPMEDAQALIKSKLGEFLQTEQVLRRQLSSNSASIRADAAGLLAAHVVLEGELGGAQAKIAQFQQGAWSLDSVFTLGDLGIRIVNHINDVASLEQRALGVTSPSSFGSLSSTTMMYGAVAVAGVALLFMYGSKSR